jgi:hypothetical protein
VPVSIETALVTKGRENDGAPASARLLFDSNIESDAAEQDFWDFRALF